MGKRADALGNLLAELVEPGPKTPRPNADTIAAGGLTDEVQQIYKQLGGIHVAPRLRPGGWDFTFDDWVLELDEENHFNRYRALTLDSANYGRAEAFDLVAYRKYCTAFESKCSTHGGYWTNASAEREFGLAGERGVLAMQGSPRWKQRAFYDYLKDLAPFTDGIAVSRIAIWDTVSADEETHQVGRILERAAAEDLSRTDWPAALLDLIGARKVEAT